MRTSTLSTSAAGARVAIKNGQGQYLCATNTTLPRWGSLDFFSALMVFPSAEHAETYMDECRTIEFDETCVTVPLNLEQTP